MSTQLQKLTQLSADIESLRTSLQPFFDLGIQNIEEHANHKEFLQLHTRMMYALQSLTYIYAGIKGKELPAEFSKVEEYFKKIEKMDLREKPVQTVDKEKVKRLLKFKR